MHFCLVVKIQLLNILKIKTMNLFYNPSLIGLRQLVDTCKKSLPVHNIVVDYDGEVIIDPETKFAGVGLNRYKFHTQISSSVKSNARALHMLFETLRTAYNNSGQVIELHRKLKSVA
jgi:hypothetical protein